MKEKVPLSRYTRAEKLLGNLDIPNSRGIEIGALDTPFLRPPAADIRFVDRFDQAALREKYAGDPNVSTGEIVPIDAVWGDKTLTECFPGERFDYVIASHVIEHVPNMIGWLAEIADVLRPDGHLILAIPDRRYSFDLLRRETSLSDLIDNHLRGVRRPTPGQIFDINANSVAFDHMMAWFPPEAMQAPVHYATRTDALARALESLGGGYVDGHCSVFTARSLLELLDNLLELRMLPFRLGRFHVAPVGSAEMSLVLLRQPVDADSGSARIEIRRLLREGVDSEGLPLDTPEVVPVEAAKDRRLAELEQALTEMRASTSWRITAPLRAFVNNLRSARCRNSSRKRTSDR